MEFVQNHWLGNTIEHWIIAGSCFLVSFAALKSAQHFSLRRLVIRAKASEAKADEVLVAAIGSTKLFFLLFICAYFASDILELKPKAEHALLILTKLSLFLQMGYWGSSAIKYFELYHSKEHPLHEAGRENDISTVGFIVQIIMWSLIGLLALNNFGVNVSALIAGLGIGGVAIALAVQNILGDLLASLSIVMDKPFVIGDSISVGEDGGTVEHIGLKTTRIRTDGGEQLIFSNSELLKSRIRNFQRMRQRKITFRIAVDYSTPVAKLELIPNLLNKILEKVPGTKFERCHLIRLGDMAANYEVVYTVFSATYGDYLNAQQLFNLGILKTFQENQISIAVQSTVVGTRLSS